MRTGPNVPHPAGPGAILVIGGTGFIGSALVHVLAADGCDVIVLSRDPERASAKLGTDAQVVGRLDDLPSATAVDAVVCLGGARVLGPPWSAGRRRVLRESRVDGILSGIGLVQRLARPPRVVIGASAVGYYGAEPVARRPADAPPAGTVLDERAPPRPGQFQSDLCVAIEEALERAQAPGVRVVRLRLGVVLGRLGGAWPGLALAARMGLGAVLGSGRQAAPWIHLNDAIDLIRFAMAREALAGPVNGVAPDLRTQAEFARALAAAFDRKVRLHVPALALKLALGEMSELLLEGQNVVSRAALAAGFDFQYPTLEEALVELVDGETHPVTV
jgi:uncharacterized protein (TIGR01777 family)